MKKLLSIILVALMLIPMGVFASAAAPEEPVLEKTDVVGYIAHGKTGVAESKSEYDGLSPEKSKPSWGIDYGGVLGVVQMGGTIVSTGKAFVGSSLNFDNLGTVVLTAVDPKTNVDYRNDDYTGTQKGSFINTAEITISGNLIFDNIYVLTRADKQGDFHVVNGGNLVIKDTVQFVDMKPEDSLKTPVLNLEKTGVAFLHAVGFSDYKGTGTIVLDKKLLDDGKITLAAFANFTGKVLDETGAVLYDGKATADTTAPAETENAESKAPETTKAPAESKAPVTTKAPETTKAPAESNAPETTSNAQADEDASVSPIVWVVAGVAAVAVVAVVIVIVAKKKKAD